MYHVQWASLALGTTLRPAGVRETGQVARGTHSCGLHPRASLGFPLIFIFKFRPSKELPYIAQKVFLRDEAS